MYFKTPAFILLASLGLILVAPLLTVAQRLSVGMKVGVATLEPVSASGIFDRQLHPLVFGPVIELALPHSLGLEASALHRRVAYRWQSPLFDYTFFPPVIQDRQEETNAISWEVPLVLRRYVHVGSRLRPFG